MRARERLPRGSSILESNRWRKFFFDAQSPAQGIGGQEPPERGLLTCHGGSGASAACAPTTRPDPRPSRGATFGHRPVAPLRNSPQARSTSTDGRSPIEFLDDKTRVSG